MKKILALFLTIILVFTFSACSKETAEKYCSECGKGISKDVAYCEHCGAKVNNTNSESKIASNTSSANNSSLTQSEKKQTAKETKPVTATSKPSAPTHTHSYSKKVTAATCTEKGYTAYTCSCGNSYKDNYTNPSHSYSNYKCLICGYINNEKIYSHLCNWICENGVKSGKYFEIHYTVDEYDYTIAFDNQEKVVFFTAYVESGIYGFDFGIVIDKITSSYFYNYNCEDLSCNKSASNISGFINSKNFNSNTKITYHSFESDLGLNMANGELDLVRDGLLLMLYRVDDMLTGKCGFTNDSGLVIQNLGFESLL